MAVAFYCQEKTRVAVPVQGCAEWTLGFWFNPELRDGMIIEWTQRDGDTAYRWVLEFHPELSVKCSKRERDDAPPRDVDLWKSTAVVNRAWTHLAVRHTVDWRCAGDRESTRVPHIWLLINGVEVGRFAAKPGAIVGELLVCPFNQVADPFFVAEPLQDAAVRQQMLSPQPAGTLFVAPPPGSRHVDGPFPVWKQPLSTEEGVPLQDFIVSLDKQLAVARGRLEERRGMTLGRVAIDARVVPAGSGSRVRVPRLVDDQGRPSANRIDSRALSTLRVEYDPPPPPPGEQPPTPRCPDLADVTEVMARRLAGAAGLGVEVFQQFVQEPSRVGLVVRQHPRAGEPVKPGTKVLVFLGSSSVRSDRVEQ